MAESSSLAFRYPGPRPFNREDRAIFKGRDVEIAEMLERIRLHQHLLLYSKSGIGKSSLLNAGVLPELEEGYQSFKFSFGAYNKDNPRSPVEILIEHLKSSEENTQLNYLDKLIYSEGSLWYHLKRLQWALYEDVLQKGNKQITEAGQPQIIIIFDQFEELFTYPAEEVDVFKLALSEALFTQIPENFRQAMGDYMAHQSPTKSDTGKTIKSSKPGSPSILEEPEWKLLHQPINLKVVFAIRSDRMSLLNNLTDCIPDILKVYYEIKPLTMQQAEIAIVEPAGLAGAFKTNPFEYEPEYLKEILQFLSRDKDHYIESFQIQIICKYIEDLVAEKKLSLIKRSDADNLENIFLGFYTQCVQAIQDIPQRSIAQKFIEEGLVFLAGDGQNGIRLNLFDEQIAQSYPALRTKTLHTLLEKSLLRGELDGSGRMRYEIAHDTLVAPILMSRNRRENDMLERKNQEEQARWQQEKNRLKDIQFGRLGTKVRWDFFMEALTDLRTVLIIGDNALVDSGHNSIPERLPKYLNVQGQPYIFYHEDQLFWFRTPAERMKVYFEMYKFYQEQHLPAFYSDVLPNIPFSLVLSLNPSNLLANAYSQSNQPYEFSHYNRSIPNNRIAVNSIGKTLVYNLCGNLDDDESLLLSHADVYKHLYGLLGNNPLPSEVRARLADARLILLAGIDFKRSYIQPILWELLYGKAATRNIIQPETLSDEELQAAAVLGLEALPIDFLLFAEELLQRYKDQGGIVSKLRKQVEAIEQLEAEKADQLNSLLLEKTHEKRQLTGEAKQALEHGNILEAIQLLLENFPENLEIIQIQRRFSEQALLLRKGGTTEEQGMLERNRINDALLEIIRNLQDDPI